jgi:hypothetical protein
MKPGAIVRVLASVSMVLAFWESAQAQAQDTSLTETRFHRVFLRNGNFVDGQMIKDTTSDVVLKLRVGEIAIRKDQIDRVELVKMRSLYEAPRPIAKEEPPVRVIVDSKPKDAPSPSLATPRDSSPFAGATPEDIRDRIDDMILGWSYTKTSKTPILPEDLAKSLESLGPPAVDYLGWLLDTSAGKVPHRSIAFALGKLGIPKGLAALGRLLGSKEPEERLSAVTGLCLVEGPEVDPYLFKALDSRSVEIWQMASQTLVDRLKKDSDGRLFRSLMTRLSTAPIKAPYTITLAQSGLPEAHRDLIILLQSENDEDVKAAIQGISLMNDPGDGELVLGLLRGARSSVKKEMCLLLGKLKYRSAVPDLIALLRDDTPGVPGNAHWALREITGKSYAASADLWQTWWDSTGSNEKN